MADRVGRVLKKKILIVDDEAHLRQFLRDTLSAENYHVLEAVDGEQALEIIRREPIDLLITDRSMPKLGGLELLKKLRDEKRHIPALMISAYGEESVWAEAIGLGAVDYLLKPFSSESVLSVVKRRLA